VSADVAGGTGPNAVQRAIRRVAFGERLTADEVGAAFDVIMGGDASATQVAALLMAMRVQGETADQVAGVARALRRAMVKLPSTDPGNLVDTCGTGGGAVTTFNISTAAALLAAGMGVRVAKHGNRSFTSRCGSADVLEALGVPIEAPLETMQRALEEAGIVFMFAPAMHPAMRHVGPVRRELGVPTVMNVVGPLANPASAGRQVVGVSEAARLALLAGALSALGSEHAMVVHGEPGLDEISPLGPTRVIEVRRGTMKEWVIEPQTLGVALGSADDLAGGSPADNARIIVDVLGGKGPAGAAAAVVLNAAAALYVAERAPSYAECVSMSASALSAGKGTEALERLRRAFRSRP
jgi:anthranilate phosphoribosyltransferase